MPAGRRFLHLFAPAAAAAACPRLAAAVGQLVVMIVCVMRAGVVDSGRA